jgi:hypothetical protein
MKKEKSPGPDGLPAEFYKRFFHLFGDAFVAMINDVFESASAMPASMRLSYKLSFVKDLNKLGF